ncbi:hypothetical protein L7F22_055303 [Adiantum nelumboides]|nr:hypothetical protein [Adiantum nelumboides]
MAAELEVGLRGVVKEEAGRKTEALASIMLQKRRSCDVVTSGEEERILQLMMGPVDRPPAAAAGDPLLLQELRLAQRSGPPRLQTLKGRGSSLFEIQSNDYMCSSSSPALELDSQSSEPLPAGWEKCLDLQTGSIYYLNRNTGLSSSCDPRTKPLSSSPAPAALHHCRRHLNSWLVPTSPPSSSSDLTFESVPPTSSCTYPPPVPAAAVLATAAPQEVASSPPSPPPHSELDLDLSLSLRPCASQKRPGPAPRRPSLKHSLMSTPFSRDADSPSLKHNLAVQASYGKASKNHKYSRGVLSFLQPQQGLSSAIFPSPTVSDQELRGGVAASVGMPFTQANASSPELSMSMITVGCVNCLMFVMLPQLSSSTGSAGHPKCPRCGASIDITSCSSTDVYSEQSPQPQPSKKAKLASGGGVSLSLSLSSRLNQLND